MPGWRRGCATRGSTCCAWPAVSRVALVPPPRQNPSIAAGTAQGFVGNCMLVMNFQTCTHPHSRARTHTHTHLSLFQVPLTRHTNTHTPHCDHYTWSRLVDGDRSLAVVRAFTLTAVRVRGDMKAKASDAGTPTRSEDEETSQRTRRQPIPVRAGARDNAAPSRGVWADHGTWKPRAPCGPVAAPASLGAGQKTQGMPRTHARTHAHARARARTHTHTRARTFVHTHIHTRLCAHMHTHTRTHTHTRPIGRLTKRGANEQQCCAEKRSHVQHSRCPKFAAALRTDANPSPPGRRGALHSIASRPPEFYSN